MAIGGSAPVPMPSGRPPPASIDNRPASALVNDSAIQANSATNSTSITVASGVSPLTASTSSICQVPMAVSTTAPPITASRRSNIQRGDDAGRGARRVAVVSDCVGIASGASSGIPRKRSLVAVRMSNGRSMSR